MKILTIIIVFLTAFLTSSCVHTVVKRTSRHQRTIKLNAILTGSKSSLIFHIKRRAELLKCNKLIITEIRERSHIKGICITTP